MTRTTYHRLIATANILLAVTTLVAQTVINPDCQWTEVGASYPAAVAIDTNNDGHLELLYAGIGSARTNQAGSQEGDQNRLAHLLQYYPKSKSWQVVNYLGPTYSDLGLNINVADRPSLSVCDMNQDGIMDIVAFETTGLRSDHQPLLDHISHEGVFLGRGNGTFTEARLHFVDASGKPADFDPRIILSADVADFNNDGLPDIVAIGYQAKGTAPRQYPTANVVLLNRGGGTFEVSNYFTDPYVEAYGQNGRDYHFEMGQVQAYDFNGDGYTDFIITAQSNDRSVMGVRIGLSTHFADVFLNDPDHPGQFRQQFLYDSSRDVSITPFSEGGIAIADYDNDGRPDLFYSGWTGNNREKYVWGIYTIHVNADGSIYLADQGHEGLEEMRNQNSTNSQYLAYDWNGDGNFDIINAGWSTALSTQTAFISTGHGDATFTSDYHISGHSEGATALIDWNDDGILDCVMTGRTDDDTFFPTEGLTRILTATVNPSAFLSRPDAPTLSAPVVTDNRVTFSWTEAPTSKKNVTFEYFVRNETTGRLVAGGNSFVGGDNDGVRKVVQPGNAFNARTVTLTLPQGRYTFGVQTVDARLSGSPFATQSFEVASTTVTALDPAMDTIDDGVKNAEGCSYSGPVINRDAPDPTVIRADDGYYYLFSTEVIHNVPVYRSKNLTDWVRITTAFTDATRPNFVSGAAIWAPDVQYVDGRYHLYFSMSTWGGEWECGIGVATANRPQGPYSDAHKLFISSEIGVQNSIDPVYFEEDGHKYLFWGSFRGIYGIELSADGLSVMDGATPQRIAGTLTEGTYIIKHDGFYYLIGSAGSCCDGERSTYHVVMARSKNLFGPYVNKTGGQATNNQFSNLLYRSADVIGPGHNANFVQDDAGQWWMLYHGFDAANINAGRKTYLSQILWDDEGWPYIRNQKPTMGAPCPLIGEQYSGILRPVSPDTMGDEAVSVTPHVTKRDITITHADGTAFSYQVVNLQGSVINSGSATGTATVSLYAQPEGMYVVTVRSATGIHTEKVIRAY